MAIKFIDVLAGVRAHPNLASSAVAAVADEEFAFQVGQLIFPCIREIALRGATKQDKQDYYTSDPTTTTLSLGAGGAGDLTTLMNEKGLLLERLRYGSVFHSDFAQPLYPLSSNEFYFPTHYDRLYPGYVVEGRTIKTMSTDRNVTALGGDLSFAVACAGGLDTIDASQINDLVDSIVMRLRGAPVADIDGKAT